MFMAGLAQLLVVLGVKLHGYLLARLPVFTCSSNHYMDMFVLGIAVMHRVPMHLLALSVLEVGHHLARPLAPVLHRFIVARREHDFVITDAVAGMLHHIVHGVSALDIIVLLRENGAVFAALMIIVAAMFKVLQVRVEMSASGRAIGGSAFDISAFGNHSSVLQVKSLFQLGSFKEVFWFALLDRLEPLRFDFRQL